MKKTVKIVSMILLAMVVISFATTSVLAVDEKTPLTPTEVQNNANYTMKDTTLLKTAGKIIGLIRNISVIAAVIIIMILGVKYMMGSVEEKAEYKKSFVPLIIGIICVVAASSIAAFIFNVV